MFQYLGLPRTTKVNWKSICMVFDKCALNRQNLVLKCKNYLKIFNSVLLFIKCKINGNDCFLVNSA